MLKEVPGNLAPGGTRARFPRPRQRLSVVGQSRLSCQADQILSSALLSVEAHQYGEICGRAGAVSVNSLDRDDDAVRSGGVLAVGQNSLRFGVISVVQDVGE